MRSSPDRRSGELLLNPAFGLFEPLTLEKEGAVQLLYDLIYLFAEEKTAEPSCVFCLNVEDGVFPIKETAYKENLRRKVVLI